MNVCRAMLVVVLLLAVGVAAAGDDDAALTEMLEQLDGRIEKIDDLTARFEQRKHTVLLREPIVSAGTVRVAGQQLRWDTRTPAASSMLMDESVLKIHYPDHNTLEVYALDDRLGQLAASPLPRLSTLREHFHITRDDPRDDIDRPHVSLHLTPRSKELAEHVQQVRVALDEQHGYLLRMEMTDIDEERTVIVFDRHRVNTGIDGEALELQVPAGTRTVRPLEDVRGRNSQSDSSSRDSGSGR